MVETCVGTSEEEVEGLENGYRSGFDKPPHFGAREHTTTEPRKSIMRSQLSS
jgi:hypothetical protein